MDLCPRCYEANCPTEMLLRSALASWETAWKEGMGKSPLENSIQYLEAQARAELVCATRRIARALEARGDSHI